MCSRGRSWPWTQGAGSPIQASIGQRWHFVGDSITAFGWYAEAGGFVDQLQALIGGAVTVTEAGVSGDQVIQLASKVHERVAIFNPDVVVIHMGINDVRVSTSAVVFEAAFESILYGIRAECPNAKILVLGIFLFGEQWATGPLRFTNGFTTDIDDKCTRIASLCATYGAAYVDLRGPALLYEQANNTPEPGVDLGVLMAPDNFHPSATGEVQMGTWAMEHVVAV